MFIWTLTPSFNWVPHFIPKMILKVLFLRYFVIFLYWEKLMGILVGFLGITSVQHIGKETFKFTTEYILEADFLGTCPMHLCELHFS